MKKFLMIVLSVFLAVCLASCKGGISEEEIVKRSNEAVREKLDEEMQTVNEFYKYKLLLEDYVVTLPSYSKNIEERLASVAKIYLGNENQAVLRDSMTAVSGYEKGTWKKPNYGVMTFTGIRFKTGFSLIDRETGKNLVTLKDSEFVINDGARYCNNTSGEIFVTAEVNLKKCSIGYIHSEKNGYTKAVVNGKDVNLELLNTVLAKGSYESYYEYEK